MIDWNSMRMKSVNWIFSETVSLYGFLSNRFLWKKFVEIVSIGRKSLENNWIDLKTIELNFVHRDFVEVISNEVGSMETAFNTGEKKRKTTSLTGKPRETISHECNALEMVPLKENPPNQSIGNPRKILSTTKKWWKSIWSERNLFHNLRWRNFHGKHLLIASL